MVTVEAKMFSSSMMRMYVRKIYAKNCQIIKVSKFQKSIQNPTDVIFIDWQLSRYGPPIIDIFYFILSTTDKSFRDKHFTDLLDEYYSTLSSSMDKLGSDSEKMYSRSKFESDLIRFNRFPLIFACVSVLFRLADESHIMDLDEYAERICKGERPNLILQFDPDTEILFKKDLNEVVTDVIKYCGIN